jgi:hypothetical protein
MPTNSFSKRAGPALADSEIGNNLQTWVWGARPALPPARVCPESGDRVKSALPKIHLVHSLVGLLLVAPAQSANAQEGIRSGLAQVTLMARSAPRGSIRSVEPARQIGRKGTMIEATMLVRVSANTGYRLAVRSGIPANRIWVRDVNGVYQELTRASVVTVARGPHGAGEWEGEVRYRVEMSATRELSESLAVRYELAIDPSL